MPSNIEQLKRMLIGNKYGVGKIAWNRGKKMPEEMRLKRSLYMKAHPVKGFGAKKGIKPSEEVRRKMSIAQKRIGNRPPIQRGKDCWNWKNGISKVNKTEKQYLMSLQEYRLWRKAVFERDNYTCVWCGQRGGRLNADHIKSWRDYPELRYAIDNGRTLCTDCHKKTASYGFHK